MAEGSKITDKTLKSTLTGGEEFPVNDSGNDRKVTTDGINDYTQSDILNKGNTPTLQDTDKFYIGRGGAFLHILWSQFKVLIQDFIEVFDFVDLNPQSTPPAQQEGRIYYDTVKKAVVLFDDITGTSIELSYEIPVRAINNTGSTITNGKAVYISGAQSMKPTIELADCCVYEKSRVIGVATHDIATGEEGKIVFFGQINDLNTSTYSLGDILYLKKGFLGDYDTTFPEGGQFVVRIGTVINVSATEGSIQLNISSSDYTDETVKQTGFPDRGNVTLDFNDTTRVFTISPTDSIKTRYYEKGIKYTITDPQAITLPDEYGLFLIYYNGANLAYIKNPNDGQVDTVIRNNPTISYILYNDDIDKNVYFANELHNSIGYGEVNHSYNHFTRGAQYLNGLGLTDIIISTGALNSHAQFGVEGGGITDEDLPTFGTTKASTLGLPIYWLEDVGGTMYVRRRIQPGYSVIQLATGERLRYNNPTTGTLDLVDNNDFVCCHVFGSNAYEDSYMQIAICGQAEYNTAGQARNGALTEIKNIISGELPTPEFAPIATVIFQSGSYANDINGRIVQSEDPETGDLVDWVDWRNESALGGGGTGAAIIEFSDEQFKVFDDADISKIVRFDNSEIPTDTTRSISSEKWYESILGKLWNIAQTHFIQFDYSLLTANRTATLPNKNITIAGLDDIQSVEKDPFTETIEITNLLQNSPNYTQTGILNIIKGAASIFINGVYEVGINCNGSVINFSSDFEIARNDYSESSNISGKYRFIFALMSDGIIGVSIYSVSDIVFPTIQSATVENSNPDLLVVVFSESVNITNTTGLSLNFTSGTPKTLLGTFSGGGTNTVSFDLSGDIVGSDVIELIATSSNTITSVSTSQSLQPVTVQVSNNVVEEGLLVFTDRLYLTEVTTGSYLVSGSSLSYDAVGLADKKIASGTDGIVQFKYLDANSDGSILGFNLSDLNENYLSMEYYVTARNSDSQFSYGENGGASVSIGVTASVNDLMRLRRTSGVIYFEYSTDDGANWILGHTFATTTTADLFVNINAVTNGREIIEVKETNLITK